MSWRSSSSAMRVQLREQRSDANFLLSERFNRAVYGDHPAAKVSATAESLDALKPRTGLRQWHRERYATAKRDPRHRRRCPREGSASPNWKSCSAGWKKTELKPTWPRDPVARKRAQSVSRPPAQFGADDGCAGQHRHRPAQPRLSGDDRDERCHRRRRVGAVVFQSPRGERLHLRRLQRLLPRCVIPARGAPAATCARKSLMARW